MGHATPRVSTTVDEHLLSSARELRHGATDAALLDEALGTFLAHNRAVEIDASYSAYETIRWIAQTSGATWQRFARAPQPRDRDPGQRRDLVV